MSFKGVIFDLDGTLLNTIDDLADSMNYVLKSKGFPSHDVLKYKHFIGNGLYNLVERTLPMGYKDEAVVKECFEAMRIEYNKHMTSKTRPYEGIPELLDELCRRGIKIAILSNKPDAATKFVTAELLTRWSFDCVFGERANVPRKPDPSGAHEIINILGLAPEEFLYLGDSGVDMETASNAGVYGVGALWGFRAADELMDGGAKILIKNPDELLQLL